MRQERESVADVKAERLAAAAAFQEKEREAFNRILQDRRERGGAHTDQEMRALRESGTRWPGEERAKADASLFVRAITQKFPAAAYIVFEALGQHHADRRAPAARRAIALNADYVPLGMVESMMGSQLQDRKESGLTADEWELNKRFAAVFVGSSRGPDAPTLRLSDAARTFDDGTHKNPRGVVSVDLAYNWTPDELSAD